MLTSCGVIVKLTRGLSVTDKFISIQLDKNDQPYSVELEPNLVETKPNTIKISINDTITLMVEQDKLDQIFTTEIVSMVNTLLEINK